MPERFETTKYNPIGIGCYVLLIGIVILGAFAVVEFLLPYVDLLFTY